MLLAQYVTHNSFFCLALKYEAIENIVNPINRIQSFAFIAFIYNLNLTYATIETLTPEYCKKNQSQTSFENEKRIVAIFIPTLN